MGKYTADSEELLKLVGGKENIAAVSHCMTRMRFVLTDPKKADVKKIEAMKVVKGSFTQAGQFQVIMATRSASSTKTSRRLQVSKVCRKTQLKRRRELIKMFCKERRR